jgi:energy-coupling factor transporter ATP-binding protein EcfA2
MFDFFRKIIEKREVRADAKAAAEIEAIKMATKMKAETGRVADAKAAAVIEAIKMATKMKAEAGRVALEAVKIRRSRRRIWASVGGTAFLLLLGDFIYHDSETFVKWNMKRKIRNGSSVTKAVSSLSAHFFKFPLTGLRQLPPLEDGPLLLIGPSGCGKTTVLHDFALQLRSNKIPVVLVNFRELQHDINHRESKPEMGRSKEGDTEAARQSDGTVLLTEIAKRICNRISFPYRRSFIIQLMTTASFSAFGMNFTIKDIFPLDFFVADKAIDILFECCEEISDEGVTPVLLFDEVYDLIKDNNLEKIGGGLLFNKLGSLLCRTCVDSKKLKAICASSSYKMVRQFKLRTVLRDDKVVVFRLADIEPELIIARLIERGYSESEATKFLDVIGPRLRKLTGPLKSDPRPELQSYINAAMVSASDSFDLTFSLLDQKQRRQLLSLLEILEKKGSVRYEGENGKFIDHFDLSRILYISSGFIIFQSKLHETFWAENCDRLKTIYKP